MTAVQDIAGSMGMTSKISICLKVGPQATGAFVPNCPGCWVFGRIKERTIEKGRIAIIEWAELLKKYGEDIPDMSNKVEIEVAEILSVKQKLEDVLLKSLRLIEL